MKKISEIQGELLIDYFGDKDLKIASQLLDKGKCVIPNNGVLWKDLEISKYISYNAIKNSVGCVEAIIDINGFIGSDYFQGIIEEDIEQTEQDILYGQYRLVELKKMLKK